MLGAMLYVNAGKGHYVPAKALSDSLEKSGHTSLVEDMFVVLNSPFWEFYCKFEWRFMLHYPTLERILHRFDDNKFSAFLIRNISIRIHVKRDFLRWYEKIKPDFIVCTNFLGGNIITPIVQELQLKVPVFIYAADVFNNPTTGYNPNIDCMYISTFLGRDLLIKKGFPPEKVKVCAFPLQSAIANLKPLTKQEARKKLRLSEKFTVLLNFGGEGIGNTEFVYEVAKRSLPWQVLVVGNLASITLSNFARFQKKYPNFTLHTPGFVSNIGEYICCCDVQAGKAGANSLMESMALGRPFLVSDLLYAARDTTAFLNKHQVGWTENQTERQVDIIQHYFENPEEQVAMEKRFASLPLKFDSEAFLETILEDTQSFYQAIKEKEIGHA